MPNVLAGFLKAWRAMAQKGSHTLGEPLQALGRLLAAGDRPGAAVYLGLLHDTFARDLTYEEGRYLSRALPRTALGLALGAAGVAAGRAVPRDPHRPRVWPSPF